MHELIGFVGFKQSGKSTAAKYLAQKHGYNVMAFAYSLKEAAKVIFDLTDEQVYDRDAKETVDPRWDKTPRRLLQLLGGEVGRAIDKDVWIKSLLARMGNTYRVTVEDCRHPNEAEAIQEQGGLVVGIWRGEVVPDPSPDLHASERNMLDHWDAMVDVTIDNNGTLKELYERLDEVIFDT